MRNQQTLTGRQALAGVRKAIRADLRAVRADPSLSFDCLVAVTEASTNALVHGTGHDDTRHPEVAWDIRDDSAVFEIQDFSTEQWSRAMHPSRDMTALLDDTSEERVGGFGLHLMRELMDDVEIARGPLGTVVTLTKRLGATAALRS
ncbi:MAG TPA: ATP-binding protein [Actinomycetota bacterium]|jgi:anti-sigma regulatory factor (Ser/Thr protein kinase)